MPLSLSGYQRTFHLGSGFRVLTILAVGLFWIGLSSCIPGLFGDTAGRAREGRVNRTMDRLTDQLHLTAEQAEKIRPIIENDQQARDQIVKQDQIRVNNGGTSMGTQLRLLRQDTEDRLAKVLTPEQLAEYRKLRDKDETAGPGGPPPPQRP